MLGADSRPLRERLVGSWRLLSDEVRDGVGVRIGHPLGKDATGCLRYTADGSMSVKIMRPGRLRHRAGGLGTDTEAARGYVAYAGPPCPTSYSAAVVARAMISLLVWTCTPGLSSCRAAIMAIATASAPIGRKRRSGPGITRAAMGPTAFAIP
jgi:hypothetical protein